MSLSFAQLHPGLQALCAGIFTWSLTAAGAAVVFFFRSPHRYVMDAMLGLAAGIMLAASYFSLLALAIEMANTLNINVPCTVSIGFLSGGLLLFVTDQYFLKRLDCTKTTQRSSMLMFSITLHNIPEGLAIGVGFGSLVAHPETASLMSAVMLTVGIGLQNFPEGTSVSMPLYRDGFSRSSAFFYGQLSGLVEPLCSCLGALMVLHVQYLMPFMLSFAAGAMIYVAIVELIPESLSNPYKSTMGLITVLGFVLMMILDLSFG